MHSFQGHLVLEIAQTPSAIESYNNHLRTAMCVTVNIVDSRAGHRIPYRNYVKAPTTVFLYRSLCGCLHTLGLGAAVLGMGMGSMIVGASL